jgi:lactate dehydrogenase-like 2-hydroxyacid dehydrogenase
MVRVCRRHPVEVRPNSSPCSDHRFQIPRRLQPFDVRLHYFDRRHLPETTERELGLIWHPTVEDMVRVCDVITINLPLHPLTENLCSTTP